MWLLPSRYSQLSEENQEVRAVSAKGRPSTGMLQSEVAWMLVPDLSTEE